MRLFVITALLVFGSCNAPLPDGPVVARDAVMIETGRQVNILYSDSARVRARIEGPILERHVDRVNPREIFPNGIVVVFYDELGEAQSTLRGRYAERSAQKGNMIVRDSVVWESVKQERLETSELIWDEKKQLIYSDKFVRINRPGEVAFGYGFKTNSQFTNWQIEAVEGIFNTERPEGL